VIGFGGTVIGERACSEGFGAVLSVECVAVIGFGGTVIGEHTCSEGFGVVL
jgi:hypothetical protein